MDARSAGGRVFSAPEAAPPPMQWRQQISLLRRRLPLFVVVVASGWVLLGGVILAIPPAYVATAEVVIDPRHDPALDLRPATPSLPADTAAIDTEVELLKSPALAAQVVDAQALDRDPEFNPAVRHPLWIWEASLKERSADQGRRTAIDRLAHRLKIARVGFTYVIAISMRSPSPEKAASIANAYTDFYLHQQLDAKSIAARRASDLLNGRLGGLRAEVDAAEREVERYKAAHGLMTLTDSQGATATEQEISGLDAQLATAKGEQAEAEARLSAATAQTAAGRIGDDVGEVLNSPVVQELRKQRDEIAKQIAELQGRYGPRHPELLKAQRQRAELDAQINQEIGRVISNLKVQVQVARRHSAAIASAVATAKAEQAKSNNASVELKALQQNLDAARTLYQAFLDRSKQTLAQNGMAQADARWVAPAKPPLSPVFPGRLVLLGAALAASVLAGLVIIWIVEAREDGLYGPEEAERRLNLPCLGLIPRVTKPAADDSAAAPVEMILSQPLSGFAEAFRTVKTGLLLTRASGPIRTVAVASALPGEGKTTMCMCLGRIMARTGSAAVVVDCDLRRRAMSRLLAAAPRIGLLDVLAGTVDLEEALVLDHASGLWLLPIGAEALSDDDKLDSPAMTRVLEALRRRFRVVLLDTAPVLMVAETTLLAASADAVLFLARWAGRRRRPLRAR